jgi:hypothetical protein
MRISRLVAPVVLAAGLVLAGCSSPAPVSGGGGSDGGSDAPVPPATNLPAWYGSDFDAAGCPVPTADSGIDVFPDAAAFLQTDVPAGWCMYSTIDYLEYYAIPAAPAASFDSDVRAALGPAGWDFDPTDDESPQWSWIAKFPSGSEEGFEDGAVDGAIFTVDKATADDLDTYQIWFAGLVHAFGGDWAEGDQIRILGFW